MINKRKIFVALALRQDIYKHEGCGVGGYAHIVVDDNNVDIDSIVFCLELAYKHESYSVSESGRQSCINFLEYFKTLNRKERYLFTLDKY